MGEEKVSLFDDEGFFHTGDVVELLPEQRIRMIDRVKNCVKLAQGEMVALQKLETLFSLCPSVLSICVIGDFTMTNVCAVVVPKPGLTDEEAIRNELVSCAQAHQLRAFEIPFPVVLSLEGFSVENDCLTPSHKLKRRNVEKLFAEQLKKKRQLHQLQKLGPPPPLSDAEAVCRDLVALFSAAFARQVDATTRFGACGGDSVAAVTVMRQVTERYGVHNLSSALLIQENLNCIDLSEYVCGTRRASFELDFQSELRRLVDETRAKLADQKKQKEKPVASAILVTGATGFLGRLCCESLRKQNPDATIFCLLRPQSRAQCPAGCVPLLGDLEQEYLGLAPQRYQEVQQQVGVKKREKIFKFFLVYFFSSKGVAGDSLRQQHQLAASLCNSFCDQRIRSSKADSLLCPVRYSADLCFNSWYFAGWRH